MMRFVPNWHPILVHFTIALLTTAVLLFVAVVIRGRKRPPGALETVANWNLWIGVGVTALTIAAGLQAEATVPHGEAAHEAMENHEYWALGTAAFFALLAVWNALRVRERKNVNLAFVALMLVGLFALTSTGLRGANLVFNHGVGVKALQQTAEAGHSHEAGAGTEEHGQEAAPGGGSAAPAPPAEVMLSPEETEVVAALQAYHDALTTGDVAAIEAHVLPDDGFMMIEGDHVNHGWSDYRDNHLKGELADLAKVRFRLSDYHVQTNGALAAASFVYNVLPKTGPEQNFGSGRGTAVLVKTDAGWKIRLLHTS
jgi:uncharacterized membrane protein